MNAQSDVEETSETEETAAAEEPEQPEDPGGTEEPEAAETEAAEGHLQHVEPAEGHLQQVAEDPAAVTTELPAEPGEPEEREELAEDAAFVPAAAESELPALAEDADLEAALEALLLVVDSPAEVELLATAVDTPPARVSEALRRMAERYAEQGRGIDLRHVGGGWRFYTRDQFAPFVEKLLLDGQRSRLTRAALETLAVIAYRQPVTRSRVAAVRGVNVDGVIRTLLARGLIEETGTDADTGGFLYRTTELFLERLGLSSLDELPPIAPLLPEVDSIDDV